MTTSLETAPPAAPVGVTGGRWDRGAGLGVVAFGLLALPFTVIVVRLVASGSRVALPDDLALIDLHTRQALGLHQQLGPFDRFGWNHPGPAEFYVLAAFYRLLGNGAKAAFVGATVVNAATALFVVWAVRRRQGPLGAVWAALCVGLLALVLSFTGPASVTYSEGPLGALVSPWNPMVVVVPLVLLGVLAASAAAGSWASFGGALVVATFCVQSDVSTLPLATTMVLLGLVGRLAPWRRPLTEAPGASPAAGRAAPWLLGAGVVVTLVAWVPPILQQLGGHPGNLTLLWRFFTTSHPGPSWAGALHAVVSADSVLVFGPAAVMQGAADLAPGPHHALMEVLAAVLLVGALGLAGWRRQAFPLALAVLGAAGSVVSVVAVTHVAGLVFGYLVLFEVAVPTLALLGAGLAALGPSRSLRHGRARGSSAGAGVVLSTLAMALAGVLTYRMVALPPLARVSDPTVSSLTDLVTKAVPKGRSVFVGDAGLPLLRTEAFIGLVNQLDEDGRRPRVNSFWVAQFGPGFLAHGRQDFQVILEPPASGVARRPGYLGQVGGIAVTLTPSGRGPRARGA